MDDLIRQIIDMTMTHMAPEGYGTIAETCVDGIKEYKKVKRIGGYVIDSIKRDEYSKFPDVSVEVSIRFLALTSDLIDTSSGEWKEKLDPEGGISQDYLDSDEDCFISNESFTLSFGVSRRMEPANVSLLEYWEN